MTTPASTSYAFATTQDLNQQAHGHRILAMLVSDPNVYQVTTYQLTMSCYQATITYKQLLPPERQLTPLERVGLRKVEAQRLTLTEQGKTLHEALSALYIAHSGRQGQVTQRDT